MLPSLTVLQVVLLSLFTLITPMFGAEENIDDTPLPNLEVPNVSDIVIGEPTITGAYCDLMNGTININVISGPPQIICSIDGGLSWQTNPFFDNLGVDDYLIIICDENDPTCCITTTTQIPDAPDLEIVEFDFACQAGENSADFTMSVSGGTAEYTLSYDLPGGGVYSTNSFNNVIPFTIDNIVEGNYTIYVEDRLGCVKDTTFFVEECCTFDFVCNNPPLVIECIGDVPPIDSVYTDGITNGYSDLDSLVAQGILEISANCYEAVVSATDTPLNDPSDCQNDTLKINRTYLIDQNGTEYICNQSIFVLNYLAPTLEVEASDLILECDPTQNITDINTWLSTNAGASASGCEITWTNNFNGLSDECGQTGATFVEFSYTDQCGNIGTTEALLTIEDTTVPEIQTEAQDLNLDCGMDMSLVDAWLANNGGATAEDICSDNPITWTHDFAGFMPDCGMSGETLVTFTSTDNCQLFSITTAFIRVTDPNAFQVLCPSDLEVDLDDPNLLNTVNTWLELATTDDPCFDVDYEVSNDFDASQLEVECDYLSILVTFTATNACGVEKSCSAQILASQSIGATINCPDPLVLQCGDPGNEAFVLSWIETASAMDHEGLDIPLDNNFNIVETVCGTTDITFSGIDNCGQSVNCASQIIIEDLQAPTINCPTDLNLTCGEDAPAIEAWLNSVTAEDACGVAFITNNYGDVDFELTCGESGNYEVTFVATDICGNTEECTAKINIFDDSDIDIMCPPNLLLDESVTDIDAEVQAWLATAQVIDPCDLGLEITNDYGTETITFDCGFISGTVNFEIESSCGAVATCTATVSGNVDVTPVINCVEDITLNCGDASNESLIADWVASVTAEDFAGFPLEVENDLPEDLGSICGVVTVEFTSGDDCENDLSCTHTITIEDNITPEIVCQNERVIDLSIGSAQSQIDDIIANTSLLDNCSSNVTLEYELNVDVDNIGCGDVEMMTLIATDDCGNETVCETEVTFIDYNDIYIDCPDPLSVSCLEENLEAYIEDYLYSVNVQTSRLPAELTNDYDSSLVNDDCNDYISFDVEFIAVDECGTETRCIVPIEILPEMKTFVPNVFTPDGDGFNDLVTVYANKNVVIVKEWFIFDRWGEVVFRAVDIRPNSEDLGWNGMFKGRKADQNVYTYILTVQDDFGREEIKTGSITLMN